MRTTFNLVQGEAQKLGYRLRLPCSKKYGKDFYDKKFIKKLAETLKRRYSNYEVAYSESEEDYILTIKET